MSQFVQPGITYLTEEEIFSLPTLDGPPAGGEGVGDGVEEEHNSLALGWSDSEMSEVFQTLLKNSEIVVDVQVKADHQRMQSANSGDVQHVQPFAPACESQCKQMWAPNEVLKQPVQTCSRRPQQRKAAKASASNVKPRPIPRKMRKQFRASAQRKGSLKRVVERKWVDVEKEKALAVLFAKQAALIRDAKASLEPYGLYYIPRSFPNSRLIHPFLEPSPDRTLLPNMYPVLNSSDFAQPSASVQQVISPTQGADHIFERKLPPSAPQAQIFSNPHLAQIFANPHLAHTYQPATMTPPTAPLVDHFFVQAPTTGIDRLEYLRVVKQEEQVSMPIQYGLLMSSDSECQLDIKYGPSFTTTTTQDSEQVLAVSSPLFPEDIPESTFLELDIQELKAVLANQVFPNARTEAASSASFPAATTSCSTTSH